MAFIQPEWSQKNTQTGTSLLDLSLQLLSEAG